MGKVPTVQLELLVVEAVAVQMAALMTLHLIPAQLVVLMAAVVEVAALKKPLQALASTRTKTEALEALEQCGSFGGMDVHSHQPTRRTCKQ